MIGDVGGTNIRLLLKKIYLNDPDHAEEIIKDAKYQTQAMEEFETSVALFLQVSKTIINNDNYRNSKERQSFGLSLQLSVWQAQLTTMQWR